MNRGLWMMLAASLAAAPGCKKQTPPEPVAEPEPEPEPEPPPALEIAWGQGSYAGMHGDDATGALTVPVTITNNRDTAIDIDVVELGVNKDDARVCDVKFSEEGQSIAGGGQSLTIDLTIDCPWSGVDAQRLPVEGSLLYTLDGEHKRKKLSGKVKMGS